VLMSGRIIAGYATVHDDAFIPLWQKLGEAVHQYDGCKFIMQLSHSGRQMDIPGVHNYGRPNLSSTSKKESLHGFLCKAATKSEIDGLVKAFADGAWRAREAGLDGVELHGANGYLITQFLSSAINDRKDEYGGALQNRARFVIEIVKAMWRIVYADRKLTDYENYLVRKLADLLGLEHHVMIDAKVAVLRELGMAAAGNYLAVVPWVATHRHCPF